MELKEQLELIDYKGTEVGIINVEVVPCSSEGNEFHESDDHFVDTPAELVGKPVYFYIKIHGCRGLSSKFNVS